MQRASLEALIGVAKTFPVDFEELSRLQELLKSAEVFISARSTLASAGSLVEAPVHVRGSHGVGGAHEPSNVAPWNMSRFGCVVVRRRTCVGWLGRGEVLSLRR